MDSIERVTVLRDEMISVRDPNPQSVAFLEAGFSSKPLDMKGKTERVAALIPRDQRLGKAGERDALTLAECQASVDKGLEKGWYTTKTVSEIIADAPTRVARKLLKSSPLSQLDANQQLVCDADGRPLTADYDLLSISRKKGTDDPLGADKRVDKPDLGTITSSMSGTLIDLNVQVVLDGYAGGLLFHHGPEQFNDDFTQSLEKSMLFSPVGRSVSAIPGGPSLIPGRDQNPKFFHAFLDEMSKQGFTTRKNKNWGSPEEHRLKAKLMADCNDLAATYPSLRPITQSMFSELDLRAIRRTIRALELKDYREVIARQRMLFTLGELEKLTAQ